MASAAKTWVWIVVGVVGTCVIGLFALAGAGAYFVTQHIGMTHADDRGALETLDAARARFKGQTPLIEIDSFDRPRVPKPLQEMAGGTVHPTELRIIAWRPDEQRIVRVSLPFWMLRFGHHKMDLVNGDRAFDLERLDLDVNELARVGPALVLDFKTIRGDRVLIWTQ